MVLTSNLNVPNIDGGTFYSGFQLSVVKTKANYFFLLIRLLSQSQNEVKPKLKSKLLPDDSRHSIENRFNHKLLFVSAVFDEW